jgi:hypothetical protein
VSAPDTTPQHTPGPWHWTEWGLWGGPRNDTYPDGLPLFIEVSPGSNGVESSADLRLIAAAPDLLAALHALVDDCSNPKRLHLISLPVLIQVEKAFGKAEGRDAE